SSSSPTPNACSWRVSPVVVLGQSPCRCAVLARASGLVVLGPLRLVSWVIDSSAAGCRAVSGGGLVHAGLEVGLEAGDHQFDALLEVGGSVVAGEFGGQGAQAGEFAAREVVQAEPEQFVGLVGVVDEFL